MIEMIYESVEMIAGGLLVGLEIRWIEGVDHGIYILFSLNADL